MNKLNYILILAVLGLVSTSCEKEFLNPVPTSSISANGFFTNDDELLAGIYAMYDGIQGVNENTQTNWMDFNRGIQFEYLMTEMRSDNTRSETTEGSKADFHRYLVNANNIEVEDYYASMYEIIFRANTVLNFIGVADPGNVGPYTGEAQFVRAYAYFNLVRLFGDVPLVTSTVNPGDDIVFIRVPVATVYEQIVSDLTNAVSLLGDGGSKSRASKGAAQALLAKVYLSQPSPDYAAAQLLCESIIDGGQYSLLDNFNDVFYSELNDELIFGTFELAVRGQGISKF
ncbi:MAG: RagB/SusD family nutrient uptake outer membrane protein [Bacteroidota bacterium]